MNSMKKIFLMLLAMMTIAGSMTAQSRYHRITVDGVRYVVDTETTTAYVTFEDDETKWTEANYAALSGTLTIHESVEDKNITYPVTGVGVAAFAHCQNLETVILPNTVTMLEESAFSHSSIAYISLPKSVNIIKSYAFASCPNLESVNVPEGVDSIPEGTFSYDPKLRNVSLPNSLTKIGKLAFSGSPINAIAIADGVTEIGEMALLYCDLSSLVLPAGLTTIGDYAFSGNPKMQGIYVDEANTHFCTENGILFNKARTELISYPTARDGRYIIPDGIQTIKKGAFLTGAISSVSIPASVTTLEGGAFYGCTHLFTIECYNPVVPVCGERAFDEVDKENCLLYVPIESLNTYETTSPWREFVHITGMGAMAEETEVPVLYKNKEGNTICTENVTLHLPEAPFIEGFIFQYWQVAEGQLKDGIILQAVYQTQSEGMPSIHINPANRAQKLIRNGNVYILSDDKVYTLTGAELR